MSAPAENQNPHGFAPLQPNQLDPGYLFGADGSDTIPMPPAKPFVAEADKLDRLTRPSSARQAAEAGEEMSDAAEIADDRMVEAEPVPLTAKGLRDVVESLEAEAPSSLEDLQGLQATLAGVGDREVNPETRESEYYSLTTGEVLDPQLVEKLAVLSDPQSYILTAEQEAREEALAHLNASSPDELYEMAGFDHVNAVNRANGGGLTHVELADKIRETAQGRLSLHNELLAAGYEAPRTGRHSRREAGEAVTADPVDPSITSRGDLRLARQARRALHEAYEEADTAVETETDARQPEAESAPTASAADGVELTAAEQKLVDNKLAEQFRGRSSRVFAKVKAALRIGGEPTGKRSAALKAYLQAGGLRPERVQSLNERLAKASLGVVAVSGAITAGSLAYQGLVSRDPDMLRTAKDVLKGVKDFYETYLQSTPDSVGAAPVSDVPAVDLPGPVVTETAPAGEVVANAATGLNIDLPVENGQTLYEWAAEAGIPRGQIISQLHERAAALAEQGHAIEWHGSGTSSWLEIDGDSRTDTLVKLLFKR